MATLLLEMLKGSFKGRYQNKNTKKKWGQCPKRRGVIEKYKNVPILIEGFWNPQGGLDFSELSDCAFQNVCPRGSSAANMFSILKMSEFDPSGSEI